MILCGANQQSIQILVAQMNSQYHKLMGNAKILNTFTQFTLFQFVNRTKKQLAEGNCIILQSQLNETSQTNVYLKMNSLEYLKKVSSSLFVQVKYQSSTAYLFFHETNKNIVYAITMLNQSPYLPTFQQILTQKAKLLQYDSSYLNYQEKLKIDFHCENIKENQVIFIFSTIAKVGKTIGNFFGFISQNLTKAGESIETAFNSKVQSISRDSFSPQTRTSWQSFKHKASNLNEKLGELIKPVSDKGGQVLDQIGESYNKSQVQIIKSFRRISFPSQKQLRKLKIRSTKDILLRQYRARRLRQREKPITQSTKVLNFQRQSKKPQKKKLLSKAV